MDYASKYIYDFKEYITRYDHSITVALLTWKCTKDKKATLAGLFHDIGTPCFSHVIDYMNKDYENQESTEEYTEEILKNDTYLIKCLKEDNIEMEDIINFKKYNIVDNNRPKVCADRLDGVILTGISWTKNVDYEDIENIINDIEIYNNEIGFKTINVANKVLEISKSIDIYCHSNEDNYMMELLASITRYGIDNKYITYEELYTSNEEELISKLKKVNDDKLLKYFDKFENITSDKIPSIDLPKVKIRDLNPNNLTMKDIDKQQHRVKIILLNSKDEVLLCKRNGVYNFIGGHIEKGEGPLECAQREVREETGMTVRLGNFRAPFYKLECFEKNYYNLNKNYFTTIQFLECRTDDSIDLDKRELDEEELKQDFKLEYISYKDLRSALERNREVTRTERREFIIDEMLHVLDQYDEYLAKDENTRGRE